MDNVPNTNTSYVFPSIKVLGITNINKLQINGQGGPADYVLTASGVRSGVVWAPVNASSIFFPVKKVTSSYTVQLGDYYIGVNGTSVVITLPLGSTLVTGKTYVIKDESGQVTPNSAYRFTIQGSGSDLIDASTSITVTVSFISLTFLWNGTRWSII